MYYQSLFPVAHDEMGEFCREKIRLEVADRTRPDRRSDTQTKMSVSRNSENKNVGRKKKFFAR